MIVSEQVWVAAKNGNELAFGQVVVAYRPLLFAFLLNQTNDFQLSEDLEQDVWIKIYQHKHKIKQLRPYLFQVARNMVIDTFRKNKHKSAVRTEITPEQGKDAEVDLESRNDHFKRKLKNLVSKSDFEIYQLSEQGYQTDEIADMLGIKSKTVSNRKTIIKKVVTETLKNG